jgi:hypothetical protein
MRNARQIAVGCLVLASIPVVGWLSFSYHFLVGIVVTMVYGAGASLVGMLSIGRGALAIATDRRARQQPLPTLPKARLLGDGKH